MTHLQPPDDRLTPSSCMLSRMSPTTAAPDPPEVAAPMPPGAFAEAGPPFLARDWSLFFLPCCRSSKEALPGVTEGQPASRGAQFLGTIGPERDKKAAAHTVPFLKY